MKIKGRGTKISSSERTTNRFACNVHNTTWQCMPLTFWPHMRPCVNPCPQNIIHICMGGDKIISSAPPRPHSGRCGNINMEVLIKDRAWKYLFLISMKRAMKWSIAKCMLHWNEHFFLPKRVASMKKHINHLRKNTDNSYQDNKKNPPAM